MTRSGIRRRNVWYKVLQSLIKWCDMYKVSDSLVQGVTKSGTSLIKWCDMYKVSYSLVQGVTGFGTRCDRGIGTRCDKIWYNVSPT